MEGKKGKIAFLVLEAVVLLAELLSGIIFMTEELINRPLYLVLLVLSITGAFLFCLKGEKLPKAFRGIFAILFLFAILYRVGEMAYYLGNQLVTVFKILFLNTGDYEIHANPLGYGVLLAIYLVGFLYFLYFAYKRYAVWRYPEEADRFFLMLQPQYGLALAQFLYPASSFMAHIRGEAESVVSVPVPALWFWILNLVAVLIFLGVLLYQKAHPAPEAVTNERNQGRKKKKKKNDSSKPAYRRKK